jgi:tetratricopeptide (TPR) repeat protein
MATYNKRGYKTPKPKAEKAEVENEINEALNVDEKNSNTANVFNALDTTASKTEEWVEKNQKIIFGVVGAIALVTLGYFAYNKFVVEPKETDANEQMFVAQENFKKATESDGKKADSLYSLSLKGAEGKFGFTKIASEYSSTKAGNLANYYAGIASLNTGKYDDAIKYLNDFKASDKILNSIAIGAMGDANSQKGKSKEAIELYIKAAEANKNEFTTPLYLLKAGKAALASGDKISALKYFTDIKENYENSQENQGIDALIGLSQ